MIAIYVFLGGDFKIDNLLKCHFFFLKWVQKEKKIMSFYFENAH